MIGRPTRCTLTDTPGTLTRAAELPDAPACSALARTPNPNSGGRNGGGEARGGAARGGAGGEGDGRARRVPRRRARAPRPRPRALARRRGGPLRPRPPPHCNQPLGLSIASPLLRSPAPSATIFPAISIRLADARARLIAAGGTGRSPARRW